MARESKDIAPEQAISLNITPEQLAAMVTTKKPQKAEKIHDGDHIGAHMQPIVGKGEGLKEYEQWLVRMNMASRPSTNPLRMQGVEGYPVSLDIIKLHRTTKSTERAVETDNKHVAGCSMTTPNQPNDLLYWFEKGKVKMGDSLPTDMIWQNGSKIMIIK